MAIKTHHNASTKAAPLYSQMGFSGSKQQDPIKRVEKDITAFNPDIDNNGGSLYNNEEFSIVHKFENDDEKQRRRNEEDGYGDVSDAERMITQDYYFYSTYDDSDDWSYYDEDIFVPPHYTADDSYIGRDGETYTPILDENGEVAYLDADNRCVMDKGGLASTTPAKVNDDLIDSAQAYNITYAVDAQGNETKRSANDANFQKALTDIDNKATKLPYQLDMVDRIAAEVTGANNFKSTASSGIQTDVKPTESFSAAASPETKPKSVVFKKDNEPLPWEKKPTADVAANSPQFGLTA